MNILPRDVKLKVVKKTAKEKYNIQQQPKLILRQDEENAQKIFGRTAHYNPENQSMLY